MQHRTSISRSRRRSIYALAPLVYELLDAHDDTARLSHELGLDSDDGFLDAPSVPTEATTQLRWRAHLDYLRALQRTGRETLAHTCEGSL